MKGKQVAAWLHKKWEQIAGQIFVDDANCLACGREIPRGGKDRLCKSCRAQTVRIGDDCCVKCGRSVRNESDYCIPCQHRPRAFARARSVYPYEGAAGLLVRKLKFSNARYLAKYMAAEMVDTLLDHEMWCDVVVPVPLSKQHRKRRGYNQAELLARVIAEKLKLPLDAEHLIKIRDTAEQAKLSGAEREDNVRGAYQVQDKFAFAGRRVLLIDDVMTTGATGDEIARILLQNGAKQVELLTYCSAKYRLPVEPQTDGTNISVIWEENL